MKQILLFFLPFFIACQPGDNQPNNSDKEDKSLEAIKQDDRPLAVVTIDNPADYSEDFVNILKEQKQFTPVHLSGDSMIIDGKSIPFPNVPILNQEFIFRGDNKNIALGLIIKRFNYSSISYTIEMEDSKSKQHKKTGIADMSPYFFLGAESDVNELTDQSYFALEYSDTKGDCYTNIRIGIDYSHSDEGEYAAKIVSNCNGDCKDLELEKSPVLVLMK